MRLTIMLLGSAVLPITFALANNPVPADSLDLQQRVRTYMEAHEYQTALREINAAHVAAVEKYGAEHVSVGLALVQMGRVLEAIGDRTHAEVNYAAAVRTLEKADGVHSRWLHEPLYAMASLMKQQQRCQEALPLLRRVLGLHRRNFGVLSDEQDGIVVSLSECLEQMNEFDEARAARQSLVRFAEARYGANDVRLCPTLNEFAGWLARIGDYMEARALYRRAIQIIEQTQGPHSTALVTPLLGIVDTHKREHSPVPEIKQISARTPVTVELRGPAYGTIAKSSARITPPHLRPLHSEGWDAAARAVQLIENAPAPAPELAQSVYLAAGDWYMFEGDYVRALNTYKNALAYPVPVAAANSDAAASPLSEPVLVRTVSPPAATLYLDRRPNELVERSVVVEFTVTARGSPKDPRVVESDAGQRLEVETVRALRKWRFRPRFENGEPQDTPGVRVRQVFRVPRPTDSARAANGT